MFPGERLRSDLRELHKLGVEMRACVGEEVSAGGDHVDLVPRVPNPLRGVNVDLLLAVHDRTLAAARMLLLAMEALPTRPRVPWGPRQCVSRPSHMTAAPLMALLWAQVCQLRAMGSGDAGRRSSPMSPTCAGQASQACQTEDSCLMRCEACCVAEAAVKALVQAFCAELEEPAVAEQRLGVAAGLGAGLVSQWGAMRALTSALRRDLDDVLRNRGAALAALEVERTASSQSRRDAEHALQRAHAAEEHSAGVERLRRAAEERLAELEATGRAEQAERALLAQSLDGARAREADLEGQLQAARAALDESQRRAEALKAEHGKLRKHAKLSQERQALLLRYPDLHGPLQPLQHEAGDPVLDMECQVQANEVRVSLLTRQNERLKATIAKLRALTASGRPPTRNHSRPTSASSPSPSPAPV